MQLGLEVVRDSEIGHSTPGLSVSARLEFADLMCELEECLALSRRSRVVVPIATGTNDETTAESTATASATKKSTCSRGAAALGAQLGHRAGGPRLVATGGDLVPRVRPRVHRVSDKRASTRPGVVAAPTEQVLVAAGCHKSSSTTRR